MNCHDKLHFYTPPSTAAAEPDVAVVKLSTTLLSLPREIHDRISTFLPLKDYLNFRRYTCRRLYVWLLEQEYHEPSELLELAVKRNNPGPILYILLHRHPMTIDASKNNNHLIRWAAIHGYTDIVQALLCHPCVWPDAVGVVKSIDNKFRHAPSSAIVLAARMGHLKIVQLLLSDFRVESQSCHNALVIACASGQIDVVNLLLARVNPAAKNSLALRQACHYGHVEIVKLLLRDKRVNPAAAENLAYYYAYERGYYKIAELLLKDTRVQEGLGREVGWMDRD